MTIRRCLDYAAIWIAVQCGVSAGSEPPVFEEYRAVGNQTTGVVFDLIAVLKDENSSDDDRRRAIRSLARLRDPAAIRPILDHLLIPVAEVTRWGTLGHYPAAQALYEFGSHVYPPVWAVMRDKRPDIYWEVLACTLYHIDGQKVALLRLEEKLKEQDLTQRQRQNIGRVLGHLKTKDYMNPADWPKKHRPADE